MSISKHARKQKIFKLVPSLYIDCFTTWLTWLNALYVNEDLTKFSIKRISEEYDTFSDKISKKYPGYMLDKNKRFVNVSDREVNLDELK